jgi:hypothetical protein
VQRVQRSEELASLQGAAGIAVQRRAEGRNVSTAQTRPGWLDDAPPAFDGALGKAWKFPMSDDDGDWRLAVSLDANYLIHAPSAHPFWAWHVLMAISLRDIDGQPAARKRYPDATHELMVYALDPNHPPPDPREWPLPPDDGSPRPLQLLQPPDVVVQFHVDTDEQATEIATLAAKACTTGLLAPDEDHRGAWEDTIATTAQHYREGRHT